MANKNPSKNGQSFLLTNSGWASQKVKPFWLQSQRVSKSNHTPALNGDCLFSGGLNIRVGDSEAVNDYNPERLKQLAVHDHNYIKKFTESAASRKSRGINDLVMRAISDVQEERPRGEIPESIKNTQLYKCLITPVENRRRTGESFGHTMVKEIINASTSKLSKSGPVKTLRIQKVSKPKLVKPYDKPKRATAVHLSPVRNLPVPKLPVPHFVDKHQNLWTKEQFAEYDQWWQQLPSCQYAYYQLQ